MSSTYGVCGSGSSRRRRWGTSKRVRNLQKLMLRSRSNTLLAVRRVTEINAGRLTAGVDGRIVLDAEDKAGLAEQIHHRQRPWQARPVKRVYIPKADGRRRPLGIPVIIDRVLQARVAAALEPEWEARFEPRSYGFRPGRSCQDALQATFNTVKGPNPARRWVLDADLKAAFDRIDHHHLLTQLGGFPAREQVRGWLTAGVVERGLFTPTEEGTPQGSLCSAEHNDPWGVPDVVSFRSPSSVMIPALRNAFTRASTRLSFTRARTRSIRAGWSIRSKHASISASSTHR
jgi:RNA-directed DNA polymerase